MKKAQFAISLFAIVLTFNLLAASQQSLDEQLYRAARDGRLDAVQQLLKQGANIEAKVANGQTAPYVVEYLKRTPLIAAAGNGHLEVVMLLLKKGANIEGMDGNESTALIEAADEGQFEVVNFLLKKGANINAEGYYGTALSCAAKSGRIEILKLLLDKGANLQASVNTFHGTPLTEAAKNGHTDTVRLLLEKAGKTQDKRSLDSALTWAAKNGHTDTVRFLLEEGANVQDKGSLGAPLNWAAKNGHTGIVRLLLENGADVDAEGGKKVTPLILAVDSGHADTVQLLLAKGANIEARNDDGDTALLVATCSGPETKEDETRKLSTVKLLLERSANIDATNKSGQTALTCTNRMKPASVAALLEQASQQRKQLEQAETKDPAERFATYLAAFQKNPQDDFLREKIIALAITLPETPTVPEEARQLFAAASSQIKKASTPAELGQPIALLQKTVAIAPWWANAYYNLSRALELSGQYDEAVRQLNYYLKLNPPEADAREARAHIVVIQTMKESTAQKR